MAGVEVGDLALGTVHQIGQIEVVVDKRFLLLLVGMAVKLGVVEQHGWFSLDFWKDIDLSKYLLCCHQVFVFVGDEVFAFLQTVAHLGQESVASHLVHVLLDVVTILADRYALSCCHQQHSPFSFRVEPERKIFAKNVTALYLGLKE